MKTILFHGPSGSGKDTQVEMLLKKFPIQRIATGEMFRTLYAEKDPEGIKAYEYWGNGLFNPAQQVHTLLRTWLKRFDVTKDWVFVSAVRGEDQIDLLDGTLKTVGRKLDLVILFMLSDEAAIERMSYRRVCPKCQGTYHPSYKPEKVKGFCDYDNTPLVQRDDDMPEKIKSRLHEYNRTIDPILDQYRERGILVEIDASGTIEDIHNEVVKAIGYK